MSRDRDYTDLNAGSYLTDNSSGTGLDVFRHQDNSAPPPNPGHDGTIWSYYTRRGGHYDKDLVEDANNTVDVLLIFAGLFSAVVTAFISQTYPMLQPDPKDLLVSIYMQLRTPGIKTTIDEPFVAPDYAVRVNCFLFASLFTSMFVAFLGILVKEWTRNYQRELAGVSSPHLRARIRHFRFNGAKRWHLASIVGLLSIFMHLALFISAVGIIDLLMATAPTVGYVALSVFLLGALFLLVTTVLPLFALDAPFRSPVSKFLSGMKRRLGHIQVSSYIRDTGRGRQLEDGPGDKSKEEGLEDYIEQSQGGESDDNSMVRTKISLDLDIICHLLSTADKSTERWLLDLCFEKLPKLKLLERNEPHAIHSRGIILEVYNFLAQGCVKINKRGEEELDMSRSPRAIQLCKFLAWYLTLPCTPEERDQLIHNLNKRGDPTILAEILAQDDYFPSIIAAKTALGYIEHLKQPIQSKECPVCWDETKAMAKADPNAEPSKSRDEKKVQAITSLLIKRTDCLRARTESVENISKECSASLEALQVALQTCNPTEKDRKLWMQALAEKEDGTFISLKVAWFTPLRITLTGLHIKRGSSPFRLGELISYPGSIDTTLQPPRSQSKRSRRFQIKSDPSPLRPGDATSSPGSNSSTLQPPRLHISASSQSARDGLSFQQPLSSSSGQSSIGSTISTTPSSLKPELLPLPSPNHLSP